MTSEEALITLFASYNYNGNYQELIEARETLEKDLEVLEIIKRKLIIATNFVSFIAYDNDEEYIKIMEWIINEINKNKSVDSKS